MSAAAAASDAAASHSAIEHAQPAYVNADVAVPPPSFTASTTARSGGALARALEAHLRRAQAERARRALVARHHPAAGEAGERRRSNFSERKRGREDLGARRCGRGRLGHVQSPFGCVGMTLPISEYSLCAPVHRSSGVIARPSRAAIAAARTTALRARPGHLELARERREVDLRVQEPRLRRQELLQSCARSIVDLGSGKRTRKLSRRSSALSIEPSKYEVGALTPSNVSMRCSR